MPTEKLPVHAVILAGGRGTRFWPRSRTRTPKQLLNIVGKGTMLEQTVARLRPLVPAARIWTVTNAQQESAVRKQLAKASRARVLVEPVGRNTAAAIALAAFHIQHFTKGDVLMAVLPADHYIAQTSKYQKIVGAALHVAHEPGRMVVLGIPPTRPETGFGYIERTGTAIGSNEIPVYPVRRFAEKPGLETAKEYLASGNYQWNAGMFFWRVSTILDELKKHLPRTFDVLQVGSWEAVYELLTRSFGENIYGNAGHFIESSGNFVSSPGKFIAAIGVNNLVIVETPDALLICPRDRAQDVGKIVKWLEQRELQNLL